jgi:molybdate transport system ATP-binding protein
MPEPSPQFDPNQNPQARPKNLLGLAIRKKLTGFDLKIELSLAADQGQVLVLFGPSGSGKTMTLSCIAGATDPDAGVISIGERVVFDSRAGLNVKLTDRRVGYLPQNYGLFPHLNVTDNIAFGLFKWEKRRAESRVKDLVNLMQLDGLEKRFPRQLSGGQQQRVAFARALAPDPAILLLDEPFSALDANIRAELRDNLAVISRKLDLPVVFITHDLEEAYILADRIAVYERGQVLQYGSRDDIFYRPATPEVARLVNSRNIWPGQVQASGEGHRPVLVRTGFGNLWANLPAGEIALAAGSAVTVCLRPEQANLLRAGLSPDPANFSGPPFVNRFKGEIAGEIARGAFFTLFFRVQRKPGEFLKLGSNIHPGFAQPYDIELQVPARHYQELKSAGPENLMVEIEPGAVHLITQLQASQ